MFFVKILKHLKRDDFFMDKDVALEYIRILKKKMRETDDEKLKLFYISDIVQLDTYLNEFLKIKRINYIPLGKTFQKYLQDNEKFIEKEILELININNYTEYISNLYLNIFENENYINDFQIKVDLLEKYIEAFEYFISTLGLKYSNKYYELKKENLIKSVFLNKSMGMCYDFVGLKKQMILVDFKNKIYQFFVLIHELGHAIHFDYLNGLKSRPLELNIFQECLPLILEIKFMNFLEENNILVKDFKKIFFIDELIDIIRVNINSYYIKNNLYKIKKDNIKFKDFKILKNKYIFLNKKIINSNDYIQVNIEFYSLITALVFLNQYNKDNEILIEESLEFLGKSEVLSLQESLELLEIEKYFPNELKKQLTLK